MKAPTGRVKVEEGKIRLNRFANFTDLDVRDYPDHFLSLAID